jgi:N-formylglutamate deformylase
VSFKIREPRSKERPLVVEIPHAGLRLDPETLSTLNAPGRAVGSDADMYVDELYRDAVQYGASVLVAEMSRYVVDLNRAESDVDSLAVVGAPAGSLPHGLIWRATTEGRAALVHPIPDAEYQRRLREYYRPYHQSLQALLQEKKRKFGYVVVLAAHSMPSSGRNGHTDVGSPRADVVPGSRGRTSAAAPVIDCPDVLAQQRGWSVAHDQPYRGGFTTAFYGRPDNAVHVVQVELNRALYMNETTLTRLEPGFSQVKRYCDDLVQALAALQL